MSQQRLGELLDKLLANDCTAAEKQELYQLVESLEDEPELQAELESAWMRYDHPGHVVAEDRSAAILKNILNDNQVVPLHKKRKLWPYMVAAASVMVLIGLGIYRLSLRTVKGPVKPAIAAITNDVKAPDKSKATLTLAGGKQILLNEVQQGTLATENGARVVMQKDGQLVYEKAGAAGAQTTYNTLNNPRGSRVITLSLPDGTKVWINAGSSITYPTAFAAGERKVTITGETYFEVKHISGGKKVPFIVQMSGPGGSRGEVTVLGTHFNVKAYEDEENAKVTLLEGSVKVSSRQKAEDREESIILKPGEQTSLSQSSHPSQPIPVQTEVVMAWKEGLFDYKRSDLTEVLRDAARWYDIEIVYDGKKPADTFTGGIDRTATLTELLTILQMTGVHFKLEGRKLIVLSGK
jgi:hypothetical protein